MKYKLSDLPSMKVTIMGLGVNGGGAPAARFFASHGAKVTVTDLRTEETLKPSVEELAGFDIAFTLGEHRESDFRGADLVIKNPAVPADSPFLAMSAEVETDISVFLSFARSPILAVTGSKGKSTVVSALAHILSVSCPKVKLGGNITRSPLSFLDELMEDEEEIPVVLELSSWQLADLRGKRLLKPRVAVVTNLMKDHQNFYHDMETYAADKAEIFAGQDDRDNTITTYDDPWGRRFFIQTPGKPFFFSRDPLPEICAGGYLVPSGGVFRMDGSETQILPSTLAVRGEHMRLNLLCAASAAFLYGINPSIIIRQAGSFSGIEHRLETVDTVNGVTFINDSAATIPEAAAAAINSFTESLVLIAGGADKNLDFLVLSAAAAAAGKRVKRVILLAGSATSKLSDSLDAAGVPAEGPFSSFSEAVETAFRNAAPGDMVVLSPGCASFGMFQNEFDRGRRFREIVRNLKETV